MSRKIFISLPVADLAKSQAFYEAIGFTNNPQFTGDGSACMVLSDAIYMTLITLTTEGFKEVRDLDDGGRAWTLLVALAGVGIIFGTVGFVAETFVAEALSGRRERRRMADRVAALKDHIILCGYGRVGSTVARELEHAGVPVVVIDSFAGSTDLAAREGHLIVEGDATRNDILIAAGVMRAKALITTVDTDATNVYVTLSARSLNPKLFIVARANEDDSESKLRQAGADRAVSPYTRAGRQIAELATRPRVADFIDFALSHGQLSFTIEELDIVAEGPLAGQTVADLTGRGIHVMAIVSHGPRQFAQPQRHKEENRIAVRKQCSCDRQRQSR